MADTDPQQPRHLATSWEQDEAELVDERGPRGRRGPSTRLLFAGAVGVAVLALVSFAMLRDDGASTEEVLDRAIDAHVEGRVNEAQDTYEEVLRSDPANKLAHYNLGLIAQTQGRLTDAERSYRLALDSDPAYEPALFNLAVMRFEAGDNAAAILLYEQIIGTNPAQAAAHLNLGYALRADGRLNAGNDAIQRAVELDPSLASKVPPEADASTTTAPVG